MLRGFAERSVLYPPRCLLRIVFLRESVQNFLTVRAMEASKGLAG